MSTRSSYNSPVVVRTSRPSGIYRAGESIGFHIQTRDLDGTKLKFIIVRDSWTVVSKAEVRVRNGAAMTDFQPDAPGFYRLSLIGDDGSILAQAAAAYAPDRITASLSSPTDFEAFWLEKHHKAQSCMGRCRIGDTIRRAGVVTRPVEADLEDAGTVYGWLHRPSRRGPFPALALYHGAGVYPVSIDAGSEWVKRGFMVLSINPHSIPNDRPREFYARMQQELADYRTRGKNSRETIYFAPMFLRAAAAVDLLADLREWDGKHLFAVGHSQSGGQALAAAALNRRVTGLVTSCCTHCDLTGPLAGRAAGWPQIVAFRRTDEDILDYDPHEVEAARYIDGANFAPMISCPAHFSICFLDDLCPATGIYAASNALRRPATVHHEPSTGHLHTPAARDAEFRWVCRQGDTHSSEAC